MHGGDDPNLKSYCHIPQIEADELSEKGQAKRYRVETINWTYATDHQTGRMLGLVDEPRPIPGSSLVQATVNPNEVQVHRNVYSFTLKELIEFIRDTADVAEDIIGIEAEIQEEISGR
jgi:hypothetical protein